MSFEKTHLSCSSSSNSPLLSKSHISRLLLSLGNACYIRSTKTQSLWLLLPILYTSRSSLARHQSPFITWTSDSVLIPAERLFKRRGLPPEDLHLSLLIQAPAGAHGLAMLFSSAGSFIREALKYVQGLSAFSRVFLMSARWPVHSWSLLRIFLMLFDRRDVALPATHVAKAIQVKW